MGVSQKVSSAKLLPIASIFRPSWGFHSAFCVGTVVLAGVDVVVCFVVDIEASPFVVVVVVVVVLFVLVFAVTEGATDESGFVVLSVVDSATPVVLVVVWSDATADSSVVLVLIPDGTSPELSVVSPPAQPTSATANANTNNRAIILLVNLFIHSTPLIIVDFRFFRHPASLYRPRTVQ